MKDNRLTFHKPRRIAKVPSALLVTSGLRKRKGRALIYALWNEEGQPNPNPTRILEISNEIVKLNLR